MSGPAGAIAQTPAAVDVPRVDDTEGSSSGQVPAGNNARKPVENGDPWDDQSPPARDNGAGTGGPSPQTDINVGPTANTGNVQRTFDDQRHLTHSAEGRQGEGSPHERDLQTWDTTAEQQSQNVSSETDGTHASEEFVVDPFPALTANAPPEQDTFRTQQFSTRNADGCGEEASANAEDRPITDTPAECEPRRSFSQKREIEALEEPTLDPLSMEHEVQFTIEMHYFMDKVGAPLADPVAAAKKSPPRAETKKAPMHNVPGKKGAGAYVEPKEPLRFFVSWKVAGSCEGRTEILHVDSSMWQTSQTANVTLEFLADLYEKPVEFRIFRVQKMPDPHVLKVAGARAPSTHVPAAISPARSLYTVDEKTAEAATAAFREASMDALSKRVFSLAYTKEMPAEVKKMLSKRFVNTQGGGGQRSTFLMARRRGSTGYSDIADVDAGDAAQDAPPPRPLSRMDEMTRSDESVLLTSKSISYEFGIPAPVRQSSERKTSVGGRVSQEVLKQAALAVSRPRSGFSRKTVTPNASDGEGAHQGESFVRGSSARSSRTSNGDGQLHASSARRTNRPKTPPKPHHFEANGKSAVTPPGAEVIAVGGGGVLIGADGKRIEVDGEYAVSKAPIGADAAELVNSMYDVFKQESEPELLSQKARAASARSAGFTRSRPKTPPQPHHAGPIHQPGSGEVRSRPPSAATDRGEKAARLQVFEHQLESPEPPQPQQFHPAQKRPLLVRPKTPPQPHQSERFEKTVKPIPVARNMLRKKPTEDHVHVGSVFVNTTNLFLGDLTVDGSLRQKVDGIHDFQVALNVKSQLLSPAQEDVLNPMCLEITSIKNMPDKPLSYAQLRRDCLPVYVKFKILDRVCVNPKMVRQAADLDFESRYVFLTGMHDEDRLRGWLLRERLVIEVHDRNRRIFARAEAAGADTVSKPGSCERDPKKDRVDKRSLPNEQELAYPKADLSHIGVATFSLADLVTGVSELRLSAPVLPGPHKPPIPGTTPPLPPGLWLEADTRLQLRVRLKNPLIGFPALATAAAHGEQVDVDAHEGLRARVGSAYTKERTVAGQQLDPRSVPLPCGVFSRAVVVLRRRSAPILAAIERKIMEVNSECLEVFGDPDDPEVVSCMTSYRLSPDQRSERELDLITGIHLYDKEGGVYYLEGLCYAGMPDLIQEISRVMQLYPHKCRLLTSKATYPDRLWMECYALPCHFRLDPHSLKELLSMPRTYFHSDPRTWHKRAESRRRQNIGSSSKLERARRRKSVRIGLEGNGADGEEAPEPEEPANKRASCFEVLRMLILIRNLQPTAAATALEGAFTQPCVVRTLQDVDRLGLFPTLDQIDVFRDLYGRRAKRDEALTSVIAASETEESRPKTGDAEVEADHNNLWVRSALNSAHTGRTALVPDSKACTAGRSTRGGRTSWRYPELSAGGITWSRKAPAKVDDWNKPFLRWLRVNGNHHPNYIAAAVRKYPTTSAPREKWYERESSAAAAVPQKG